MIIHAEHDHIIPFSDGQALYDACPSADKTFLKIPGANHNDIFMRGLSEYMAAIEKLTDQVKPSWVYPNFAKTLIVGHALSTAESRRMKYAKIIRKFNFSPSPPMRIEHWEPDTASSFPINCNDSGCLFQLFS